MDKKDSKQSEEHVTESKQINAFSSLEKFWVDNLMKTFIVLFGCGVTLYTYPSFTSKICALITLIPMFQILYNGIKTIVSILKTEKN